MTDFSLPENWLEESSRQWETAQEYRAQAEELWEDASDPRHSSGDAWALRVSAITLSNHAERIEAAILEQRADGFSGV